MSSPSAASESEAEDREDVLGPGEVARPELRRVLEKDEGGHAGHDASTPGDIPAAGWWQVLRRVWRETSSDQMSIIAASCAFYALLALFPAISVLISLYGLALDPAAIEHQLIAVRDVLPAAAYDLVAQRLHDLASKPATALSWGLALSLAVALWSAS
ncbi:MAG: YihY/virulence factor BrkB family protein, partial [Geminicoccaceae bacterium]